MGNESLIQALRYCASGAKFPGDCDACPLYCADGKTYVAELAAGLGMTLEDVCQLNVDKLRKRYPDGFDPERSMHREEGDI